MHSWRFNTAVVILWLATMSWLVKEKVLPPLLVGEPPNYSRIIGRKARPGRAAGVSWSTAVASAGR